VTKFVTRGEAAGQLSSPKIFKIMCSCQVQQHVTIIFPRKYRLFAALPVTAILHLLFSTRIGRLYVCLENCGVQNFYVWNIAYFGKLIFFNYVSLEIIDSLWQS